MKRDAVWISVAVAIAGVAFAGGGYLNGDAAAYAAQGWAGDLLARPVHAGWAAVAVVLAPVGGAHLPALLDVVVALAAAALVLAAGGTTEARLLAASFVLPWCAFGEVDVPWMAAMLGAARTSRQPLAALGVAAAVAQSPTAMLALPWTVRASGRGFLVGVAVATVLVLTVVSQGAWWTGHRGVLGVEPMPGRTLEAWAQTGVWVVVPVAWMRGRGHVAWLLPLLLAPPDVPAWVFAGVVASSVWGPGVGGDRLRWLVVTGAVAAGLGGLVLRGQRVATEHRQLVDVAAHHRPGAGYAGPWSWGTRLSVIATKRTDGLPFRPDRPLQDGRWPAPDVQEVGLLPPGRRPDDPGQVLRTDDQGVVWVAPWWTSEG